MSPPVFVEFNHLLNDSPIFENYYGVDYKDISFSQKELIFDLFMKE